MVKIDDTYSEGLAYINLNGKYGYKDPSGKIIIQPSFKEAVIFNEGMAFVSKDGKKWGCIDRSGEMIIAPTYDTHSYFEDGFAIVKLNGKSGVINTAGEVSIPFKWRRIFYFESGLFMVMDETGCVGLKDWKDTTHLQCKYLEIGKIGCGIFSITDWMGTAYMDRTYKIVISYMHLNDAGIFSEGLAYINLNGKYGYIDMKGNMVIEDIYEDASCFSEGLAVVRLNGRYGYINKKGKMVIQNIYDTASVFIDGLAEVKFNNKVYYIDPMGNYRYM